MVVDAAAKMERNMRFIGVADTGHQVVMDAHPSVGGDDDGFRPMELVLVGLCGCTAMDVASILRKMRQAISNVEVKAHAERSSEHPKVFTAIDLEYIVIGTAVNPQAVERAIELSAERYCPVQAMLGQVSAMSYSYQIIEADDGELEI
jgi:putative redox protein